ncbi:MAG: ABC transporter substrate-binding protein [Thermofilaceae archaeon]|nr:ABC transporter substrate-binding protein [Thermofilaceae archaeon]MCX8180383.1 ABC transporter substrate-binding protein [Thermofilaceae archaeon]MDW8003918.1 ABC transporter substrate-binding protein [Thermofilaceae archaeon]
MQAAKEGKSNKRAVLAAILVIVALAAGFAAGYFSRSLIAGEQQIETVKIGALLPLSGDLSSFGRRNNGALLMAIEDINRFAEAVGSRFRFQAVVEDTGTDPQVARSRIESLAAQGIKAFIGPMASREVSQVKPFADANKLLVVSQSSTAIALAIPGDYVFRVVPPDSYQGRALAKYVMSKGFTKAVVIYSNDAWGVGLFDSFKGNFEALKGKVEGVPYDPNAKEYSAEISRAADLASAMGAGTAVVLVSFEEGIQIIKLASQNAVLSKLSWFGTDGLAGNSKLISEAGPETVSLGGLPCTVFIPPNNPLQEDFKQRFRQRFGEDPDSYSMNTYDATWMIALSVMLSGEYDGEKLASFLPLVARRYYGVTGYVQLDENGDRKAGNYGVYQLVRDQGALNWKLVAFYQIDTDTIVPLGG